MPLTGHCLCKAVTYTVDVDAPILTGYDHCDACQRQSGSTYCVFSHSALVLWSFHLPRPRSPHLITSGFRNPRPGDVTPPKHDLKRN